MDLLLSSQLVRQQEHNMDNNQEDMVGNISNHLSSRHLLHTTHSNLLAPNPSINHKLHCSIIQTCCSQTTAFRHLNHTIQRLIHRKHHSQERQHSHMETQLVMDRLLKTLTILRKLNMAASGLLHNCNNHNLASLSHNHHKFRTDRVRSITMTTRLHMCHRLLCLCHQDSSPRTSLHHSRTRQQMAAIARRTMITGLKARQLRYILK